MGPSVVRVQTAHRPSARSSPISSLRSSTTRKKSRSARSTSPDTAAGPDCPPGPATQAPAASARAARAAITSPKSDDTAAPTSAAAWSGPSTRHRYTIAVPPSSFAHTSCRTRTTTPASRTSVTSSQPLVGSTHPNMNGSAVPSGRTMTASVPAANGRASRSSITSRSMKAPPRPPTAPVSTTCIAGVTSTPTVDHSTRPNRLPGAACRDQCRRPPRRRGLLRPEPHRRPGAGENRRTGVLAIAVDRPACAGVSTKPQPGCAISSTQCRFRPS